VIDRFGGGLSRGKRLRWVKLGEVKVRLRKVKLGKVSGESKFLFLSPLPHDKATLVSSVGYLTL